MKVLVTLVRILVGLLFIFSGLVKANDPLGLSYKMQEFCTIDRVEDTTFHVAVDAAHSLFYISHRLYIHHRQTNQLWLFWRLPPNKLESFLPERCSAYSTHWVPYLATTMDQASVFTKNQHDCDVVGDNFQFWTTMVCTYVFTGDRLSSL